MRGRGPAVAAYAVVLRRVDGRYVKQLTTATSRYAAKVARRAWESEYDSGYTVTVEPTKGQGR